MTLDNVQALPLGTQLGDYRLDAVIGHGGFGITYRAFDGQLAKMVAIKEYLPIEFDVRRLAEGLLSGLGAVHAQNFLHRDIKPSNVIIRRDGVPILIDFGAARLAIGGRTQTLTSILTPQYAPIEQYAMDGKQGPWSD